MFYKYRLQTYVVKSGVKVVMSGVKVMKVKVVMSGVKVASIHQECKA